MTANDSTPRSGESLSDSSVNYEQLARDLLITELEREAYDIRDLYLEVARSLKDGDGLGQDELNKLHEADRLTRDLRQLVESSVERDRDGGGSR